MFAGIRLRIWIFCGVALVGVLALGSALMPGPAEVTGSGGHGEASRGEGQRPRERSRTTPARAADTEREEQAPGSSAAAGEEPPGATTPRLQADTTPRQRAPEGQEGETTRRPQTLGGTPFAGGGPVAGEPVHDPGEERVDPEPDDDAPLPEDDVDEYVRDAADETLVEMLVERRLWERPGEDEAAVYELTDEFLDEMSPEERRELLYGFMNPAGSQAELLSDYLGRPLP